MVKGNNSLLIKFLGTLGAITTVSCGTKNGSIKNDTSEQLSQNVTFSPKRTKPLADKNQTSFPNISSTTDVITDSNNPASTTVTSTIQITTPTKKENEQNPMFEVICEKYFEKEGDFIRIPANVKEITLGYRFGDKKVKNIIYKTNNPKINILGDKVAFELDDVEDKQEIEIQAVASCDEGKLESSIKLKIEKIKAAQIVDIDGGEIKSLLLYKSIREEDFTIRITGIGSDEIKEIIGEDGKIDIEILKKISSKEIIFNFLADASVKEKEKFSKGLIIRTIYGQEFKIPITVDSFEKLKSDLKKCRDDKSVNVFLQRCGIKGIFNGNDILQHFISRNSEISCETFKTICELIDINQKVNDKGILSSFINLCQEIKDFRPLFNKYDHSQTFDINIFRALVDQGFINEIFENIDDDCLEKSDLNGGEVLSYLENKGEIKTSALIKILKLIGDNQPNEQYIFEFIKKNYDNIDDFSPLFAKFKGNITLEILRILINIVKQKSSDKIFQSIVKEKFVPNLHANDILILIQNLNIQLSEDTFSKICTAIDPNTLNAKIITDFITNNCQHNKYIESFKCLFNILNDQSIDLVFLKALIDVVKEISSDKFFEDIDLKKFKRDINGDSILLLFKNTEIKIGDGTLLRLCVMMGLTSKKSDLQTKITNKEFFKSFIRNNCQNIKKIKSLFLVYAGNIDDEILQLLIDIANINQSNEILQFIKDQQELKISPEILSLLNGAKFVITKDILQSICIHLTLTQSHILSFIDKNYNNDIESYEPLFLSYEKEIDKEFFKKIIVFEQEHSSNKILEDIPSVKLPTTLRGDNLIDMFITTTDAIKKDPTFQLTDGILTKFCDTGLFISHITTKKTKTVGGRPYISIFIEKFCQNVTNFDSLKKVCDEDTKKITITRNGKKIAIKDL